MISIKEAKRLSLLKWNGELIDSPDYSGLNDYPNLNDYFYCGFCLRHGYTCPENSSVCDDCEIALSAAGNCTRGDSLYNRIEEVETDYDKRQESIRELIQIIENIPDGED